MGYVFTKHGFKVVVKYKENNGKTRQFTHYFYQTCSPFNKKTNGEIKTVEQILEEELSKIKSWSVDIQNKYPSSKISAPKIL